MAKYSFQELTNVLGGKKKLTVIAGITSVAFLFGGCLSSVARLARANAPVAETTADPKVALYGTYYGHNGSVLILKDDGNADYFYSGQSDVKHSNTWSLSDNEITINMSWLFCTVKGTVESDPVAFVLVGNSDLDDVLWDDERFEKTSDSTLAMTKAECESFITDHQTVDQGNVSNSTPVEVTEATGALGEYSTWYDASALDVDLVSVGNLSLPVPSDMTLVDSSYNSGVELLAYTGNNKAYALGYVETSYTLSSEEFNEIGESFMDGFIQGLGVSAVTYDHPCLVGGYSAIEYTATASNGWSTVTIKSMIIDHSSEGYILLICAGYPSTASNVFHCYNYAISILQGDATIVAGDTPTAQTAASGSSNVRDVLDQYETFMNEYVAFMRTYNNATPDQMLEMMDDYLDLLDEYLEMEAMLANLDVSTMSDEDYAYYLEVTARVTENLMTLY